MKQLGGKVAVVTGAASGIGKATATAFAREGMKVVLADVDEAALEKAAAELAEAGHEVLAVTTDVSKGEAMDALASRTVDEFGTFHVVHLNAGVATGGLSWTLTERDWQWTLGVNLWGVIHGIRAFVPRLVEQGEGHVVNTASMAGLTSPPFMGPYNVSKHAVVTLSETLFKELQMSGGKVGVSVLCPGWVNTGIGESSRNRPVELQNEEAAASIDLGAGALKGVLENGLQPEVVAQMVVDAVQTRRFYILTHDDWLPMIDARFDDIREQRSPSGGFFPV
ncbi:MAG TPA: SDR family NAD(P)-dependent oxidoreductase [Acidimicrobiales bacterium]|jgi:NAD(P)-dependent dehydrogenase (short-subunit alcohol dehydrogenase family)|nr:SDR family NAD(P)-dependent oxidoreductase [Acidimicrobiales bacterium]